MFKFTDVVHAKDGEELKAVIRKHGITLWPSLLLAGILIVVPFFFLFTLTKWGPWGMALIAVLVAGGLLLALRAFLIWDADVLLITTERVVDVDQRGLLSRAVCEAPLVQVQDIRWERRGLWDTFWRTGTLRIRAAGPVPEFVSPRLARPERWVALLHELSDPAKRHPSSTASDPRERIRAALAAADPATLQVVEALLRARRESAS